MLKKVGMFVGMFSLLIGGAVAEEMPGKALFKANCASCHGMDGKVSEMGQALKPYPARDLTALAEIVDRDEFRRIIAYGIQGTAMTPKKYDLDEHDIEDVIDYIQTFERKVDLAMGKKRFEAVCSTCHGMDGRAKTGMGAKNLVYSTLSLHDVAHTIRYGRANTIMTGKRHQLSNDDIQDISHYVHELRYQADAKKGKKLFASTCQSCHSTPSKIALTGNLAHKSSVSELSDYALNLRIRHGRHVNRAGQKVAHLSEDDSQDLIAYIRKEIK
ncbi:MAG: cytochrome c [Zetaproteobacteria bacterium CG2_30_46_52]|nr:MAG: cytochrome c [Zetaproteobacteria bacterium CG2_30_46_52]